MALGGRKALHDTPFERAPLRRANGLGDFFVSEQPAQRAEVGGSDCRAVVYSRERLETFLPPDGVLAAWRWSAVCRMIVRRVWRYILITRRRAATYSKVAQRMETRGCCLRMCLPSQARRARCLRCARTVPVSSASINSRLENRWLRKDCEPAIKLLQCGKDPIWMKV